MITLPRLHEMFARSDFRSPGGAYPPTFTCQSPVAVHHADTKKDANPQSMASSRAAAQTTLFDRQPALRRLLSFSTTTTS